MKLPEWIKILFHKETDAEKRYHYLYENIEGLDHLSDDDKTEILDRHLIYLIDQGVLDDELRIVKTKP